MNIRKVRNYYDFLVENSDICSWYNDNSLIEIYNSFISMLAPNPKIIDLGSGYGSETYKLSNLGARVFGIDCSEKSVEIAKANNRKAKFIVGDITTDLSFQVKEKFDAATIILTINNLSLIDFYSLLKNVKILLKKNSYLFLIYKSSFMPYVVKYNKICNKYYYSEKLICSLFLSQKYRYYKKFTLPESYTNENYKCIVFKYCYE